ncbi:hypothetical protein BDP55DRAFT_729970 [Colletotrichum godetiae]|uniref:Uncharacterized protein n=1 Tax=Colletotrichum godetiae TaxID=1209918 RepID=A0AAJ0AKR3_9PEZI|nr:uncharacterized protein BDP55DRAFT_729970 [Colletotrichum godetiae]KAK1674218.1 hypothetical protein BDP55DRAFT_729970 [Colletotrichum godetiae]
MAPIRQNPQLALKTVKRKVAVRPAKRPVNRLVRKRVPPIGSWSRPIVLGNISTLDGSQSSPIVIEDHPELDGSISKPIELEDDSGDEGTSSNPIVLVDDPGDGLDQGAFIVRLQMITVLEEWTVDYGLKAAISFEVIHLTNRNHLHLMWRPGQLSSFGLKVISFHYGIEPIRI